MHPKLLITKEEIFIGNKLKIMMKVMDIMDIYDLYFNSICIINGR
jgi:hypothetical protein